MASPFAMYGPATAPMASSAAPTGAATAKARGVSPAATPARDRPTSAMARNR
jgi:hypothetical protein